MLLTGINRNVNLNSMFARTLSMQKNTGLKSTQEKQERQQKAANQIDFWEKQKAGLKSMKCDTIEDIALKLDKFHTYENEIAAVKKAYNNEQMFHTLDESRERGEQIAKAAEENAPKTAEERKEEMLDEAMGKDETKGALSEIMDELTESLEQLDEELTEILTEEETEELAQAVPEELTEELTKEEPEELSEKETEELTEELFKEEPEELTEELTKEELEELAKKGRRS